MGHDLAIVVGDDWEALMLPHCVHEVDDPECEGEFDWCEIGGRFGEPLRFREPQARGGLLRFLGAKTHTAQARRSLVDMESLRELDPFVVVTDGKWRDTENFEEARRLIEAAPGDPLLTAVDFHL